MLCLKLAMYRMKNIGCWRPAVVSEWYLSIASGKEGGRKGREGGREEREEERERGRERGQEGGRDRGREGE